MFDLSAKVALVTGGAKGIGRETAKALAECGATVRIADIDRAALEQTTDELCSQGAKVSACYMDVTSADDWATAISGISEEFGKLNVLVNNAGIMESKSFLETSIADFRLQQSVNVESVIIGVQSAHALMSATAESEPFGCSIINLSSIFGKVGGVLSSAYCVSKASVCLLSKAIAVEFGRAGNNIRVNSVHPGAIDTELAAGNMQRLIEQGLMPSEQEAREMITAQIPMGRFGKADDIATVIAFLASDASRYMTGSEITVDGGFTAV